MTIDATPRLAGHLLVECLVAQGVTHAFGVPGESYLAVLDGLHAQRERIQFITCRQEGGAAFMAEAMGKLTGRPGPVVLVLPKDMLTQTVSATALPRVEPVRGSED
jgi:thiamine pyrophosphate-dependent acetolactate synthase large subunit-like protein